MTPDQIARVVHEANRALQIVQADPTCQPAPPWDQIDGEMRASAIDGVRAVLDGATPAESHANWLRFKTEHGWVHGPVKDEDRREHPCMVPYSDLPASQQLKDHLFGAIVHALDPQHRPIHVHDPLDPKPIGAAHV